jgi:hypothetical protein
LFTRIRSIVLLIWWLLKVNYIHQLQQTVDYQRETISQANSEVNSLVAYPMSNKFHSDPTVQVQDVQNRLQELRSILNRGY